MPDLTDGGDRAHRLRHLHRGPVLRRHGARHGVPRRPRPGRAPGQAQPATRCAGCAPRACASPPIYGRQAFKIDGKFKFWGGLTVEAWAAARAWSRRSPTAAQEERHRHPLRRARRRPDRRRRRRARASACGTTGKTVEVATRKSVVLAAAASRPTPNGARATSARAGSSPRCAARASTPATASAWRSTSAPRPCGNWSGCHAVAWDTQRARVRRPRGRRPVPEALLSVRHHDQRQRQALRRRGRRLPQLHLRQVRPRDPGAAGPVRLADLRREGACTCCATSTASSAGHQGDGRTRSRSSCEKLDDVERRAVRSKTIKAYNAAVRTDIPFNPERQGRPLHARASRSPSRTGPTRSTQPPFEAYAVTCGITFTFGGLRINTDARGDRHRRRSRSPASTRRASWSAASSISTIRAAPASRPARCSAASPARRRHAPAAADADAARRSRTRQRAADRLTWRGTLASVATDPPRDELPGHPGLVAADGLHHHAHLVAVTSPR